MRKLGRLLWRGAWLAAEVSFVGLRFLFLFIVTLGRPTLRQRSVTLHHGCRRVGRVFLNRRDVSGPRPTQGLLVSNHLSYLDILFLGSLAPTVFVSKHEVKNWPVFGMFARLGGTVFVVRQKRGHVGEISNQLHDLLAEGHLIVLFPEGTSSGGETVLPFKSSLLEPAVGQKCPIFTAALNYAIPGGSVADDVCYWRDMSFLPHFLNLLKKSFIQGRVNFAQIKEPAADRKLLAQQLRTEVLRLKSVPLA